MDVDVDERDVRSADSIARTYGDVRNAKAKLDLDLDFDVDSDIIVAPAKPMHIRSTTSLQPRYLSASKYSRD